MSIEDMAAKCVDQAAQAAPAVGIAMLGGFVRWVRGRHCTRWSLVVGLTSSAFVGYLAPMFLEGSPINPAWHGPIIALCGFTAGDLLTIASQRVCAVVAGEARK